MSKCSEEKDFGIWYTKDMKPSTQCRKAVGKAMQALGLIKRFISSESLPVQNFNVRPALEYSVPTWSPYLLKVNVIDLMERVQCRATKLVHSIADSTYEEQLVSLGLQSLFAVDKR